MSPRPIKQLPRTVSHEKEVLHPRNRHRSRYDFKQLAASSPDLVPFVRLNKFQDLSIDFADPGAVRALNWALLRLFYGITTWDIPPGYLCPPVPGRADYIHYLADLLASSNKSVVPRGNAVTALDIGVGANCIYPIIGHHEYGWHFVGSDTDPVALRSAQQIVAANKILTGAVECRLQAWPSQIFKGILKPTDIIDVVLCNPPFHVSAAAAAAGSQRKLTNLGAKHGVKPVLNFGGQNTELWCAGGEEGFVRRMIAESAQLPTTCFWFTTLISKKETLSGIYQALHQAQAIDIQTIAMSQGQKQSRLVAWTFLTAAQQENWRQTRWAMASG